LFVECRKYCLIFKTAWERSLFQADLKNVTFQMVMRREFESLIVVDFSIIFDEAS
jgi:hypothetical protein